MRSRFLLAFAIIALTLAPVNVAFSEYQPPHSKPGPAADTLRFRSFHVDLAPAALKAGDMDLYMYGLKIESARALAADPDVLMYQAPATMLSLILNPAPAPEGELNPFSIEEIRFALQYLIDRDTVAKVIYKGMAVPMITHVSPLDYDYLTIYDVVKRYNIQFDPELAREKVSDAMVRAGAVMKDGLWQYDEKPVELKFIIRVEDERREVGDLMRVTLEELGFKTIPIYQSFGPAVFTVYGTDPQLFAWHIYTEGWSRTAAERYDFGTINQMAAPWLGNMPGWQETGFWQYTHSELDQLGQQIFTGRFRSQEERDGLYRNATALALNESVRVWVATVMNSFVAKKDLAGVTEDLVGGPKAFWTLREAHVTDKADLTIGNLWIWTERTIWNPIGGFTDAYSIDIWQNIHDPPVARHPFTGIPIPFRAEYAVETVGPAGKMNVPEDAVVWDAYSDLWRHVGEGVEATSKVTFDYSTYFASKWHNGQPITMADVIYSIHQSFEMAYDDDKEKIEPSIAATSRPFIEGFKAIRILDDNRLEVYVDYWHFEQNYIAEYASLSGLSMPWEILHAMDTLVFSERKAAYSDTSAAKFNVPWLSLVMDRDARLVVNTIKRLQRDLVHPENVLTVGSRVLTSDDETDKRYNASVEWFNRYGILVIGNGPFRLVRYDPPAQYAELESFRDPSYPFRPGDSYYGGADRVEILEVTGQRVTVGSESRVSITLSGPGQLSLRFLIFDPSKGEIVETGLAERVSPSAFGIRVHPDVTSNLRKGSYQLFLVAYSDEISQVSERVEILEAAGERTETQILPLPAEAETSVTAGFAAAALALAAGAFYFFHRRRRGKQS